MIIFESQKTKNKSKRVGRGIGSGLGGHTAGRGQKGQKSRSGYTRPRPGFEGGSMPLSRRIPKLKGFTRGFLKNKVESVRLSLTEVSNLFETNEVVTVDTLIEKGVRVPRNKAFRVKVLSNGEINKKLKFEGIDFSEAAKSKALSAGCEVI